MRLTRLLAILVLAATPAGPAAAHTIVYTTSLSGANENPANDSEGTGSATVTVDFDLLTMRVEIGFSGLTGTTTQAHIHCCTAPPGNVGVASEAPSFTGFPLGVSAGTFDRTYDMTLAASYNPAFVTANGGSLSAAFQALANGLDAGQAYVNIHSSFRGGGEIRGFLQAIPEPGTLALLGIGLAAFAAGRRAHVAG